MRSTQALRVSSGVRRRLYLGAFVKMAQAAADPGIKRDYPVIAQALELAASPQIRNMATLGGNVLQRTRCTYFRDPSWQACNKREPGTGCAAIEGLNRKHAVLGTSEHCIAAYPGDLAQALVALDAAVEILGRGGSRLIPFEELHRLPGDTPHIETVLELDELITRFRVPVAPWTRRSLYLKVRDRQSYEFGLASAAIALDIAEGEVRQARIALGAWRQSRGARMKRRQRSKASGLTRPVLKWPPTLRSARRSLSARTVSSSSSAGGHSFEHFSKRRQ
jgi:xanthine dehydrogenase YagS FAD-binding subunit